MLAAAVAVVVSAADDGMTHLHLYIHETVGASSTTALLAGNNSSFGGVGAILRYKVRRRARRC